MTETCKCGHSAAQHRVYFAESDESLMLAWGPRCLACYFVASGNSASRHEDMDLSRAPVCNGMLLSIKECPKCSGEGKYLQNTANYFDLPASATEPNMPITADGAPMVLTCQRCAGTGLLNAKVQVPDQPNV